MSRHTASGLTFSEMFRWLWRKRHTYRKAWCSRTVCFTRGARGLPHLVVAYPSGDTVPFVPSLLDVGANDWAVALKGWGE